MFSWYSTILVAHSYLRWGVLGACALCAARALEGRARLRPFNRSDERLLRIFVALADAQLLLGLLLYGVVSPISHAALRDIPAAMNDPILRFFALEHPLAMICAIAVLHVGVVRSKRLGTDPQRHRSILKTTGTALGLFLIAVPWPGLAYARPLWRSLW